jgi:hypothetical protein
MGPRDGTLGQGAGAAEGEPTNFRLLPENTPAALRLAIFDVLSACRWEPAIGLDDRPVAGDTEVTIRYR